MAIVQWRKTKLCNFSRGHYGYFCDIIFEFGSVVMKTFKGLFYLSSGGHFVQQSRSLIEAIMGNICVKIILNLNH